MTQPDEYFPEDAANYGSFSAWSQKTQEDWENERYSREVTRWGRVRTGLRWEAPDGLPLGQWYQIVLTEHTESIAVLNQIAAATNSTAAYVSDIDAMATVPRASVTTCSISTGAVRPRYADVVLFDESDARDDTIGYLWRGVTPTIVPRAKKGSTVGHIYYTPIVVDRVGKVDIFRWIAGVDTSIFSIDYYEIALCVYNPANGNIEKVWSSGDIKDTYANVGSGASPPVEVAVTMLDSGGDPINQQCSPGQILFGAVQQVAPGALQAPRRIGVSPQTDMSRSVTLLDAWCYIAKDYSQGIPSSIAFASLSRENRFIPWMSVSVNAIDPVEGS